MRKWSVCLLLFMVLLSLGACSNIEGSEPQPPATTGFSWEVIDGIAWLRGIGSVTEGDIVIPAKVMLCENDGTWTEDTENGTEYSVIVAGDAFKNCELLHTVTFHRGVQIENNQMYKKLGMFTKCENLEGVYNIPDSVISMRGTFTNCTSLREISNFPAALADLTGCFTSCTSLPSVPIIPDSVVSI